MGDHTRRDNHLHRWRRAEQEGGRDDVTVMEWTRRAVLGRRDQLVKTDLPAGLRSACVEDEQGAVILVDGSAPPADQMVATLREQVALIRRRCERRGTRPFWPVLTAGLAALAYAAATVLVATARGTVLVLEELAVPPTIRLTLGGLVITAAGAAAWQVCPFTSNLW